MAATILNSEQATQMSVLVVRAFVRLRHMLIEVGVIFGVTQNRQCLKWVTGVFEFDPM
jgi:hypothetical protein